MEVPVTPSFRLDGRRALVTGASRGIGFACASALAQAGAHVTLCARSEAELDAAAQAIVGSGGAATVLPLDVRDVSAVRAALSRQDTFDVLVNNAGVNRPRTFVEVTEEDYDAVLDLNLRAAFFVAQTVAAGMVSAGRGGSIIHMSSQMGKVGGPQRSLYCASKWAIEGLNKAMALDLAAHGVRSNTVCPTFIETELTRPFLAEPTFHAEVLRKVKLGRLGRCEDLMGAVVFLASAASALVTGTSLLVDGGWTAE